MEREEGYYRDNKELEEVRKGENDRGQSKDTISRKSKKIYIEES
jgi:hypothetical protein